MPSNHTDHDELSPTASPPQSPSSRPPVDANGNTPSSHNNQRSGGFNQNFGHSEFADPHHVEHVDFSSHVENIEPPSQYGDRQNGPNHHNSMHNDSVDHHMEDASHVEHASHTENSASSMDLDHNGGPSGDAGPSDPHHIENSHIENSHIENSHMENSDHIENSQIENSEHIENSSSRPSLSRRSTIMLDEDEMPHNNAGFEDEGPFSRAQEGEQVELDHGSKPPKDGLVETVIEWKEGGSNVFVTGSFTGWRQMIPSRKFEDNSFVVVLKLAPGTHRSRFVVDGESRCSNYMNTATDSMGNLVNYMEVGTSAMSSRTPSMSNGEYHHHHDQLADAEYAEDEGEYTREIPEIFVDPEALDRFSSIDFTPPPQSPPHLDGVISNTNWTEKDNNSVSPIPNHVVLNHLATTSIKHNVLAVASVSRYKAKYVTQILYSPIEGI